MRLGDPMDPAIEAACRALGGRPPSVPSGFASIELRGERRDHRPLLAPLGYAATVVLALAVISTVWAL